MKKAELSSADKHTTNKHTNIANNKHTNIANNKHTNIANNKHKQLYYCKGGTTRGKAKRVLHVRVHIFKRKRGAQIFFGPHGFIP